MSARPKKIPPPLEKDVQQNIREYMSVMGWIELCNSSQGYRSEGGTRVTVGFPDELFGHPKHKDLLFVEVKREGEKATALQETWHELARLCGARVIVADSAEAVARYLMAENLL